MDIKDMELAWKDFHQRIETFEKIKEKELKEKYPSLNDREIYQKVVKNSNGFFKDESELLFRTHMILTKWIISDKNSSIICEKTE